jgi:hypothetical protein
MTKGICICSRFFCFLRLKQWKLAVFVRLPVWQSYFFMEDKEGVIC